MVYNINNFTKNTPSTLHYDNFDKGVKCKGAIERYNNAVSQVKSTIMTANRLYGNVQDAVDKLDDMTDKIIDSNVDVGGEGSKSTEKDTKQRECLEDVLNMDLSFLSPSAPSPSWLTKNAVWDYANPSLAYLSGLQRDVNNELLDVMSMVGNAFERALYVAIDIFNNFLEMTNLFALIQSIKKMRECINENCTEGKNSVEDIDPVIYKDGNSINGYVLPINPSNGKLDLQLIEGKKDRKYTPQEKVKLFKQQNKHRQYTKVKEEAQTELNAKMCTKSGFSIDQFSTSSYSKKTPFVSDLF